MDLTRRFSRAIALAVLPLVLVASFLCVCGSAAAAESPARSDHSCCPSEGDSPHQEHRADCNHCGLSQMTPHEAAKIPVPHVAPVPWLPTTPPSVEILRPIHTVVARAQNDASVPYATPPLFSLKCALLI